MTDLTFKKSHIPSGLLPDILNQIEIVGEVKLVLFNTNDEYNYITQAYPNSQDRLTDYIDVTIQFSISSDNDDFVDHFAEYLVNYTDAAIERLKKLQKDWSLEYDKCE